MCVLLRTFLLLKRAEIVPAQRDAEIAAILDREFSWVVTDPAGQTHIKWQAMTAVFAHSPLFFWIARPLAGWTGSVLICTNGWRKTEVRSLVCQVAALG